jgi:hypothetical protein
MKREKERERERKRERTDIVVFSTKIYRRLIVR